MYASHYPLDGKRGWWCDQSLHWIFSEATPLLCIARSLDSDFSPTLCMGSLLVPAPRAQQGGSRGVCSQCLQRNRMPWQPCPSLQMPLNSGTSLSCVWQVQASSYTLCCSHTTLEAISLQPTAVHLNCPLNSEFQHSPANVLADVYFKLGCTG